MARTSPIGSPAWVRRKLAVGHRIRMLRSDLGMFGFAGTLRYRYEAQLGHRWGIKPQYALAPRTASHPLTLRRRTSDLLAFQQIFVAREYSCIDGLRTPELIVDAGANVGLTSAYMLSLWPTARLVALEPDEANFRMARQNLEPFGSRARVLRRALWSHPCQLDLRSGVFRDGREWSVQVAEVPAGSGGSVEAIDVSTLLRELGGERISLLKMDIEGAEAMVFSGACTWLDHVDALVVELHEDSPFGDAIGAFKSAMNGRDFDRQTSGELTFCTRRQ